LAAAGALTDLASKALDMDGERSYQRLKYE
jgi:hypothetical protein